MPVVSHQQVAQSLKKKNLYLLLFLFFLQCGNVDNPAISSRKTLCQQPVGNLLIADDSSQQQLRTDDK